MSVDGGENVKKIHAIYIRLCDGEILSAEDREYLWEQSCQPSDRRSVPELLRSLAFVPDLKPEPVIAHYLDLANGSEVAAHAVHALCQLGLTLKYKKSLLSFVKMNQPTDRWPFLPGAALACMGKYLSRFRDKDFAQTIASIINDHRPSHLRSRRENTILVMARLAACVAMGANPNMVADDIDMEKSHVALFITHRQQG